jgi:predicted DNA binding CopG/RHH family protein
MLHPMQHTATQTPTPASPSFAGLLAALTAPAPRTAWNNDDFADDVATLSYEHALRAHSRYKAPDAGEWEMKQKIDSGPELPNVSQHDNTAAQTSEASPSLAAGAGARNAADCGSAAFERNKKCASITIRLSKEECEQLRRRAGQAGLTVSAYLRSCTFEAETLRAQVKDVLAELRTAASTEKESPKVEFHRSWLDWLTRLVPRWQLGQRVARA